MEAIMSEQSSMHFYLDWAKERIDEMDAALASFEVRASQVQGESKVKADQLFNDLKKKRDEFKTEFKKQAEAGEAAWVGIRADLETKWSDFEKQVQAYLALAGKQIEQQKVTFAGVAAAQVKAWHEAADKLRDAATKVTTDRRADLDGALKQMKAGASEAEARFQKLKLAGSESWSALGAALAESRKAFDSANQAAWEAFKRAVPPG
jgi:hypothetical protein